MTFHDDDDTGCDFCTRCSESARDDRVIPSDMSFVCVVLGQHNKQQNEPSVNRRGIPSRFPAVRTAVSAVVYTRHYIVTCHASKLSMITSSLDFQDYRGRRACALGFRRPRRHCAPKLCRRVASCWPIDYVDYGEALPSCWRWLWLSSRLHSQHTGLRFCRLRHKRFRWWQTMYVQQQKS